MYFHTVYLPTSCGKQRVDDRRVLSGMIFVQMTGCRRRDAPEDEYGSHKTLYTRWRRWSKNGLFLKILVLLSAETMGRERNTSATAINDDPINHPSGKRQRGIL